MLASIILPVLLIFQIPAATEMPTSQVLRPDQTVQDIDAQSLVPKLDDKNSDVALDASFKLIKKGPTVIPLLVDALTQRKSCQFQFVASGIIFQLEPANKIVNQTLVDVTRGKCKGSSEADLIIRRQAAMALADKIEGIPIVVELLKDKNTFNRRSAVFAFDELTEKIEGSRPDGISPTREMLSAIRLAIPVLVSALKDRDKIVKCMAFETLEQLADSVHAELRAEATLRLQGVKAPCE